jgi:tetratricopeptide (TPR) repeat protein
MVFKHPAVLVSRLMWVATALAAAVLTVPLVGCQDSAFRPSVAKFNQAADVALKQNDVPTAIRHLEAALTLSPDDPTTRRNLVVAYYRGKQYEKALSTLKALPANVPGEKTGKSSPAGLRGMIYEAWAEDLPPAPDPTAAAAPVANPHARERLVAARDAYREAKMDERAQYVEGLIRDLDKPAQETSPADDGMPY